MSGLVVILWAMYVSECFVRCRPGEWVFRQALFGSVSGRSEPDISGLNGRFAFAWTALIPWKPAWKASGAELKRRAIQIDVARCRRSSRWLRISATVLFFTLMILLPLLIFTERLLPSLSFFLVTLGCAWVSTFAAFLIAYRRVRGARPPLETWLVLALSPVSLIRAPFVLSLLVLPSAHPMAAAAVLCNRDEFHRIARLWYFDSPELRPSIEQLARARGDQASLLAPPMDIEAGAAQFCPRCHAMYANVASRCIDCAGIELTPLPVKS